MRKHKTQSDIFQVISDIQMANFIQQVQSSQLSEKAKRAAIAAHSVSSPLAEDKSGHKEKLDARTRLIHVLLWHDNDLQSS